MSNLLRTPCRCPSPILSRSVSTTFPRHRRPDNRSPFWRDDHACQPILHIRAQLYVVRQLHGFRPPGRPVGMPLRCGCPIVQPPLRVAALRRSSREIVDADRPICRAIARTPAHCARRIASSSRSASDRYRPESGFADRPNIAGGMPPAFRNHLVPIACGTPAATAASSLAIPDAIAAQNRRCSSRPAIGGRPGDNNGGRPDRAERRFRLVIVTPSIKVLRRPLEFTQYASEIYRALLTAQGLVGSMGRPGNPYDN